MAELARSPRRTPYNVAIVVLTMNQKATTLACLESLARLDYDNFEVVVVDNGSTDGTREALAAAPLPVSYVYSPTNLGCAAGRNLGIDYVKRHFVYDDILFLDNDTVVEPGFLAEMVAALEDDPGAGLASCKIYRTDAVDLLDAAGGMTINLYSGAIHVRGAGAQDLGQFDAPDYVDAAGGACMLVKRQVMQAIKGFDRAFDPYGFEDFDFSYRARRYGFRIRYVPTAHIRHCESRTLGHGRYTAEYAYVKGRNLRRFLTRHAGLHERLVFYGLCAPYYAARALARELRRGNAGAVLALARGFLRRR